MGATDNGDLGGAASSLVVPPFERNTRATSSALVAPYLFETKDNYFEIAKTMEGRSLFLPTLTLQPSGGLELIPLQKLKLSFVFRE